MHSCLRVVRRSRHDALRVQDAKYLHGQKLLVRPQTSFPCMLNLTAGNFSALQRIQIQTRLQRVRHSLNVLIENRKFDENMNSL